MKRAVLMLLVACSKPSTPSPKMPPDPALYVGMWQVTVTVKATTCDSAGVRVGDVQAATWRMNVTGGHLVVDDVDSKTNETKDEVEGPTVDENGKHRIVLRSYHLQGNYSELADLSGDDHELTGTALSGFGRGGPVFDQTLASLDRPINGKRNGAGTSACAIWSTIKAVKK